MRSFFYLALSALAAVAAAQSTDNPFNVPTEGFGFEAGQPAELTWTPTTEGTITLKLQRDGEITPESGTTIVENIDNTGSYSFTVPSDLSASSEYTIQIIDDNDPTNYNFTPTFSVDGTTATDTELPSTVASATAAPTSTTDDASSTATETETSSSEESSSTPASTTMPSSTMMTSTMVSSSAASSTPSSTSTETDESSSATETATGAPSPGAAGTLAVPGGLVSAALALLALVSSNI